MSNGRTLRLLEILIRKTSVVKDFLALIKIGIGNSNLVTTFTALWLAFQYTGGHFLQELDVIFCTMLSAVFMMGGSGAMNNFIEQNIAPIMKRAKASPTVTGRLKPRLY